MKVSVVIASLNGATKLPTLFNSLHTQTCKADEIVLVLDGSSDNSKMIALEWCDRLPLRIVEQSNKGRSSARNKGVSISKFDLIIFYDDDIDVKPNSIEQHIKTHEISEYLLCTGQLIEKVDSTEFSVFKNWLTKKWASNYPDIPSFLNKNNIFFSAANCSISRTSFVELDGFDEALTDAEDFDLAVRALETGYKVVFVPSNVGYHKSFSSFRDYIRRKRQYRDAHIRLASLRLNSPSFLKYQVKHSRFKAGVYRFFPIQLVRWIDLGYFAWLPIWLKYPIYQWCISCFSVYRLDTKI